MESLFITGGSGFVGRRLLAAIDPGRFGELRWLSRDPAGRAPRTAPVPARAVRGDINVPESYRALLDPGVTVLHLAAATGKAGPALQRRVNVDGTRTLLQECARAGVRRVLHVSSIAAKFPEKKHYPYARAKEEGEALVRASGLPHVILRPTIVAGPGSPVLAGLGRLASLPVLPVFGDGRTRVQPLHVDELVRMMLAVLAGDRFRGETLEIGGASIVTIEDLLLRLRRLLGRHGRRVIHLPLRPLMPLLAAVEKLLGGRLPLSAGQLYSFRYDGVAENRAPREHLEPRWGDIDAMLADSLAHE
ncbi:MAG: NAD-dependent epimerase/dehydratase family protein [Candidatus Aminicenantes bacterium]|nr:NAD-dependent epimerase/dehydratase family protein [Candidatus Aminicenantes bacterium]